MLNEKSSGILFLVLVVLIVGGGVLIQHLRKKFDEYVTRRSVRTLQAMKDYRKTVSRLDPL
jgi:hypothetical protein